MKIKLPLNFRPHNRGSHSRHIVAILGIMLLSACASTNGPTMAAVKAAEVSITKAEQSSISHYGALELSTAREKLDAARTAIQKDEMTLALRLAQQSQVEAELATAKAESFKATSINDEIKQGTTTLLREMQRQTGANQ